MDKNSIIKSLKRQDEEKVAFSLKMPATLKDELQAISENENVSMNGLIVAALQSFIDDDCGETIRNLKSILLRAKEYVDFDQDMAYLEIKCGEDQDEYFKHTQLCTDINQALIN